MTTHTVVDFMNDGVMHVCGFELTKEDVVVKREFSGDTKRYEATVSEDGKTVDFEPFSTPSTRYHHILSSSFFFLLSLPPFYNKQHGPLIFFLSPHIYMLPCRLTHDRD